MVMLENISTKKNKAKASNRTCAKGAGIQAPSNIVVNFDGIDIVVISYNGLLLDQAVASLEDVHNKTPTNIILQQERQSIPLNVNQGFDRVSSDWWVLFNDDWEAIEDGWLDKLMSFALSDPDIAFVSCRVVLPNGLLNHCGYTISPNGIPRNICRNKPDEPYPDKFIEYAHPILINRKMFKLLGGYDQETFKGSQFADIDFVYRVHQAGYKIFFAGSVVLLHHHNENKSTNVVRERGKAENGAKFRAKHGLGKKGRSMGYLKKKNLFKRKR